MPLEYLEYAGLDKVFVFTPITFMQMEGRLADSGVNSTFAWLRVRMSVLTDQANILRQRCCFQGVNVLVTLAHNQHIQNGRRARANINNLSA
jgi:hypothetical protein